MTGQSKLSTFTGQEIGQRTATATSTIAYRHTTTDAPESGTMKFTLEYVLTNPTSTVVTA